MYRFAYLCSSRGVRSALFTIPFAISLAAACGPATNPGGECTPEQTDCDGACVDIFSDPQNCGACGMACGDGFTCDSGSCVIGGGDCQPDASPESCYSGPAGTQGLGACRAGTRECVNGTWGPCQGEILPVTELCSNNTDDNCNGIIDEDADADSDGWTNCGGDCCDTPGAGCGDPELVNPGAFEVAGNDVDDDCDGTVDNVLAACDTGLQSSSGNGMDYAAAMDLCQTTTDNAPLAERRWGVISANLVLTDGTGSPHANSRSIRPGFGATNTRSGSALAVLSTGHAAASGDSNPNFASFQDGQIMDTTSTAPSDWYAANGNSIPNAPGCPPPMGNNTVNDPVMLEMRIRAPTNALSFSIDSNFFSAEYPEWTCSPFNDFFVILLDSNYSGMPANPSDKNLARYTAPNMTNYPVGVNLAYGNTGLFQICENGSTGCETTANAGSINTCTGVGELSGTGMDIAGAGCGANNRVGGGTGWLATSGNVMPGEVITLRIAIWDTSDHEFDSVVLLDNFQWSVAASEPGTVIVID